jgi:ABC transport system ATP-binding/permease protein
MSEEILRALAQLYAIIAKQDDGVTENERNFAIKSFRKKINHEAALEYVKLYDELSGYNQLGKKGEEEGKEKLTSVKDSVKTLGICKKINKTLTQKQKVVVFIELLQMVKSDNNFSPQRMQIIDTVAEVFNIESKEHQNIVNFVIHEDLSYFKNQAFLVVNNFICEDEDDQTGYRHIYSDISTGNLIYLHIPSVDMIFLKYSGADTIQLNGMAVAGNEVVLFSPGSILKSGKGSTFFYSEISTQFHSSSNGVKLSFNVKDVEFKFPNGKVGLRDINISEGAGRLIAIMGASGAGKTTLLNVLAGLEKPSRGAIYINGLDLYENKDELSGVIGYIPQDDLLIEELTVFENLFYNARLCFKDLTKAELTDKVCKVLDQLGLLQARDLKVGNSLNKTISGGQRKRLNIALELIREPAVMFVDEPTSGLSSRDSENVIDLLKELSLRGTLIFVVIHQPSSDIYKMFDRIFILDTGGYPIFFGNPIEAITYFKRLSLHADHEKGQCETCGSVNPEQIFNIIEEKVVDEYGNYTDKRKVSTDQWVQFYKGNFIPRFLEDIKQAPPRLLNIPGKLLQTAIFTTRDFYSKISNKQYLLINLLEAPFLALLLAFIIRYNNTSDGQYFFRYNENIPAYLLMSVVVAIFMGLSVSAEELIRDRKIRKRETLLNLSWWSYLNSKLLILFSLSAIQTLLLVLVGNTILEIKGMYLSYWLMLFSTSCAANVMGLIISSYFNSAVTVYIIIPLVLIPQMILSGALFSFDKINDLFRNQERSPLIADVMISRWAFEGLSVNQFANNDYEKLFYPYEQTEAIANYNLVYVLPDLKEKVKFNDSNAKEKNDSIQNIVKRNTRVILTELSKKAAFIKAGNSLTNINAARWEPHYSAIFFDQLDKLDVLYNRILNESTKKKEKEAYNKFSESELNVLKNKYYNESLADFVKNAKASERIITAEDHLIPKYNLVYFNPEKSASIRTHFCAPVKQFAGIPVNTYTFNLIFIWIFTIAMYIVLYFDLVNKIKFPININFKK